MKDSHFKVVPYVGLVYSRALVWPRRWDDARLGLGMPSSCGFCTPSLRYSPYNWHNDVPSFGQSPPVGDELPLPRLSVAWPPHLG